MNICANIRGKISCFYYLFTFLDIACFVCNSLGNGPVEGTVSIQRIITQKRILLFFNIFFRENITLLSWNIIQFGFNLKVIKNPLSPYNYTRVQALQRLSTNSKHFQEAYASAKEGRKRKKDKKNDQLSILSIPSSVAGRVNVLTDAPSPSPFDVKAKTFSSYSVEGSKSVKVYLDCLSSTSKSGLSYCELGVNDMSYGLEIILCFICR